MYERRRLSCSSGWTRFYYTVDGLKCEGWFPPSLFARVNDVSRSRATCCKRRNTIRDPAELEFKTANWGRIVEFKKELPPSVPPRSSSSGCHAPLHPLRRSGRTHIPLVRTVRPVADRGAGSHHPSSSFAVQSSSDASPPSSAPSLPLRPSHLRTLVRRTMQRLHRRVLLL